MSRTPDDDHPEHSTAGGDPHGATHIDPTKDFGQAHTGADGKLWDSLHLAPTDHPGSLGRLGVYEVLNLVGGGAMGVVVRAFDPQLHRNVAIKLMSPQLMASEGARRRFFREARAAAGINHPNVVTIHAVSDHEVPFLVMEYVEGRTLAQRIGATAPMDVVDVLRIGTQIAGGLAAAHRHGVIHRDIKPSNIMLEDGIERVKITDFGLARVAEDHSDLTSLGDMVGTPSYMSPEQVNGHTLDARSDLFSLGCVMYAMFASRSPFQSGHALTAARRVLSERPRPLREVAPGVPPALCGVIERLLEKEPKDRFQSAAEVAGLLTEQLADANQLEAERSAARQRDPPGATTRRRTRNRILLAAGAAAVVLLAVWSGRRNVPSPVPNGTTSVGGGTTEPSTDDGAPSSRVRTVAQSGAAEFSSIGAALRAAGPNDVVRVTDSATYREPLLIADARRLAGLRLEAIGGAVLRASEPATLLHIAGTPGVTVVGFQFVMEGPQYGIEITGAVPGLSVRDCRLVVSRPDPSQEVRAAVYLHDGAAGESGAEIALDGLRIQCGGVGIVVGSPNETQTVQNVRIQECTILAPERPGNFGIPIVLQGTVRTIDIARNTLAFGNAGTNLFFLHPRAAQQVVIAHNTLHNQHLAWGFAEAPPDQDIRIVNNLVVTADGVRGDQLAVGDYVGWFEGNWWEPGPACRRDVVAQVAEIRERLPLVSRDPDDPAYLQPDDTAPPDIPGRYSPRTPAARRGIESTDSR